MKPKQIARIVTDALMTAALLLLMAYSLVGEAAHEWIGVAMFALFVLHHAFNIRWSRNLRKGRYAPFRVAQTALAALIFACMTGSMLSGVLESRHVFAPLSLPFAVWAQNVHMLCAYWGFALMSIHLGFHWNMMMGMARRAFRKPSVARARCIRALGFLSACFGARAFARRQIGEYMLLRIHFAFFDFSEPLWRFLLDYLAAMGLLVWIGHYLALVLQRLGKRRKKA